jgi:hypothetical protein
MQMHKTKIVKKFSLILDKNKNVMPEVFREFGFVFFFYANESQEPMHIHVRKAGGFAKFWIEPIELDFAQGMKVSELKLAEQLVIDHLEQIKNKWYEVHGS